MLLASIPITLNRDFFSTFLAGGGNSDKLSSFSGEGSLLAGGGGVAALEGVLEAGLDGGREGVLEGGNDPLEAPLTDEFLEL